MAWKNPSKKEIRAFVRGNNLVSPEDGVKIMTVIEATSKRYNTRHNLTTESLEAQKYREVLLVRHGGRMVLKRKLQP